MKLKVHTANVHEVAYWADDNSYLTVLFCYGVPVALHAEGEGYYCIDASPSPTTSKWVNRFLGLCKNLTVFVPQRVFDGNLPDAIYKRAPRLALRDEAGQRWRRVSESLTTRTA